MHIVLDTNVIVSAFLWGGTPRQLIQMIIDRGFVILSSEALLKELDATLQKPKLQKYVDLTGKTSAQLIANYRKLVLLIDPQPISKEVVQDQDDSVNAFTFLLSTTS